MINYLLLAFVIVLQLVFLFSKRPDRAMSFLLLISSINFNAFLTFNFELVFKSCFLLLTLAYMVLYRVRTRQFFPFLAVAAVLFANYWFAQFDILYTRTSFVTAGTALLTGFLLLTVNFPGKAKEAILKTLSFIPLFSVFSGLLLGAFGVLNPFARGDYFGLAGSSSSTNLSFYCVVGMAAALLLYKQTRRNKFYCLAFLNYAIIFATLTRGGIVAASFMAIVEIIPFLAKMIRKKSTAALCLILFVVITPVFVFTVSQLISRTFDGSQLNTSGRTEAWPYLISLNRNRWVGNGYGFIKTRDDYELRFFNATHNEYIHLYVELGILGMVAFGVALYQAFRRNLLSKFSFRTGLSILLAFLFYSLVDNTLTNFHFWLPFMLMMAVAVLDKKECTDACVSKIDPETPEGDPLYKNKEKAPLQNR